MRLVQTQLVAYRLGMQRQLMEKRNSSWNNESSVPPVCRTRNNSLCQQNSPKRRRSFSVPQYSSHHMHREENDETQCLNEWQLTVLRWILWAVMFAIFIEMEFGTVFFVLSLFYFIYLSLRYSRRKPWEPSAYSVYNKNCEAIDGSLTAEQFERELRYKPLS